jgi:NTE family protein
MPSHTVSDQTPIPEIFAGQVFSGLSPRDRARLVSEFETLSLTRGAVLIREGDPAEHLYIVVSGRFGVVRAGRADPVNEIGVGETIGEIAFFAGGNRTASVMALRDSIVLRLARRDYEALSKRLPALPSAVTTMLAQRLAMTTAGRASAPDPRPRTIALIAAGNSTLSADTIAQLAAVFRARGATLIIDAAKARTYLPAGADFDSASATEVLNALETQTDTILYVTDSTPTAWSLKAIRQADLALLIAPFDAADAPNDLENIAADILPRAQKRLILLHQKRGDIDGTARWLKARDVAMHHHVATDTPEDFDRVGRFIMGSARGLVAGGGGAFCVAHVGVYQALIEAGHSFDMMGGTSGGSAITAAIALGVSPAEIDTAIALSFVKRRAMRRYTLPRYSVLDHTAYDAELQALFRDKRIEDLWIPFFAVSTNLSENRLEVHRAGLVWHAVRASSAIPLLLPPFYTANGDMLVDGGLTDNVPVKVMRDFKSGPNVVMSLEAAKLERFAVDYTQLPSRGALLRKLANPFARRSLPEAPGIGTVLLRALVAHRRDYERHLGADDLHLKPPLPADMNLLDWHRHSEVMRSAYAWAKAELNI